VNLRSANLHGRDLRRVRQAEADLYATHVTGADLREADLTGANLQDSHAPSGVGFG
jgi:uncharacterized protein YjbI with pentapeptide repeats